MQYYSSVTQAQLESQNLQNVLQIRQHAMPASS